MVRMPDDKTVKSISREIRLKKKTGKTKIRVVRLY